MHLRKDLFVALEQLDGVPPFALFVDIRLRQAADFIERMLDFAAENPLHRHLFALPCDLYRALGRFVRAGALERRGFNHVAPQGCREFLDVDFVAALFDDVHHVQRNHHGGVHLEHLRGQVKVALQVGAVHQVNHGVRLLVHDVVPGNDFFQRIGRKGINPRQVGDDHVAVPFKPAFFFLDRDARPVAHVLGRTGQVVEHGRFAAVRIPCQRDFNCHPYPPTLS